MVLGTVALIAASLAALPLGMAGWLYGAAATGLGLTFLYYAWRGFVRCAGGAWARKTFLYSVVHLAVAVTVLLIDAA